jgi:hypothetical protein
MYRALDKEVRQNLSSVLTDFLQYILGLAHSHLINLPIRLPGSADFGDLLMATLHLAHDARIGSPDVAQGNHDRDRLSIW